MSANIALILGTRPEIIKMAPIIRICDRRNLEYVLIHTGQHYSDKLNDVFFEQLDLPTPDYNLAVGSTSHGRQTGKMIAGIESILLDVQPNVVLVQGDTNSTLAGAIAADKLSMKLGHVEAGLRSFDRTMPEESNRRVADHLADYLFAPTAESARLLRQEGIDEERIYVTGNTVVDATRHNEQLALRKSRVLRDLDLVPGSFALMTAHRQENVDKRSRFESILRGGELVSELVGGAVVYPIHPRSRDRIEEFDLVVPENVVLIEPQDYLDFLKLESRAALVLTDSGGVQEEACILGTPCVTLRDNTERPETVRVEANRLVGTEPTEIVDGSRAMLESSTDWLNPFGDGTTAESILSTIKPKRVMEGDSQ